MEQLPIASFRRHAVTCGEASSQWKDSGNIISRWSNLNPTWRRVGEARVFSERSEPGGNPQHRSTPGCVLVTMAPSVQSLEDPRGLPPTSSRED